MPAIPTAPAPPADPDAPVGNPGDAGEAVSKAGAIFKGWTDLSRALGMGVPSILRRADQLSAAVLRPKR